MDQNPDQRERKESRRDQRKSSATQDDREDSRTFSAPLSPSRRRSSPDSHDISRMLDSAQKLTSEPPSFMRQISSKPELDSPKLPYHEDEAESSHRCRDFPHMHVPLSIKVPRGKGSPTRSPKVHKKSEKAHKAKPKSQKGEAFIPSLTQVEESLQDDSNGTVSPPKADVSPEEEVKVTDKVTQDAEVKVTEPKQKAEDTPELSGIVIEVPGVSSTDGATEQKGFTFPDQAETKEKSPDKEIGFYIGDHRHSDAGFGGLMTPTDEEVVDPRLHARFGIARLLSQEEEPTPSPRPALPATPASPTRAPSSAAVTFQLGKPRPPKKRAEPLVPPVEPLEPPGADEEKEDETKEEAKDHKPIKKKKKTDDSGPRYKPRHVPSQKDLSARRKLGSEVHLSAELKRVPTERDEAMTLTGLDLDEMASHRFGHQRSHHKKVKHSAMASIVHLTKAEEKPEIKRKFDHSPHEMFVELGELHVGENREYQWQETARWIKYEEDVEIGSNRWGKPHVASLSFHSLLELRRCLEQGAVLLDLEGVDFPDIVNHIADELIFMEQIKVDEKGAVLKALLLKHRHVTEAKDVIRKNLSYMNLKQFDASADGYHLLNLAERRRSSLRKSSSATFKKTNSGSSLRSLPTQIGADGSPSTPTVKQNDHFKLEIEPQSPDGVTYAPEGTGEKPQEQWKRSIFSRIPQGAEATSVLVGTVDFLESPAMAFVRLSEGHYLGNLTEVPLPVRFLFVLLGPSQGTMDYHEIGRSISTLMANKMFHDVAYKADGRQDLLDAINEFLDDSLVLPPGDWDKKTLLPVLDMAKKARLRKQRKREKESEEKALIPIEEKEIDKYADPLKRTGKFFGGLVNDVKRRYPQYLSDLRDGLNMQCLATFVFIYFACLSPAITFGGLLSEKTDKWIGVSEMLVGTCVCGTLFALLSGQPLTIIGATGPVIVFEEGLYQICNSALGVEFMPMRAWVGIWVSVISVLVIMFEGSFLVRYITRFTEEIFAFLISLIFIYEVFNKLAKIFNKHPLLPFYPAPLTTPDPGNWTMSPNFTFTTPYPNFTMDMNATLPPEPENDVRNQPNTALLSVILTFGTFLIAFFLKKFRNSTFLGRTARRALGDFGIPIAIFTMVLIDFLIKHTYTQKLDVPNGLVPTAAEKRGWFINPLGMEQPLLVQYIFLAIVPALLIFILLFMETQITSVIVNKKERKLRKGSGYHLDLFLIGVFAALSGLFGTPFMCCATVRAVTHVSALSVFSKTHAPGEKPKLLEVKEQRVTALLVHIMIGISVLMSSVLRQVPLAVLFGVFLYMGVASLSGIQLVDRMELIFKPTKHYPDVGYVRRVRTLKMHLYTFIQLICLGILWAIKSSAAALAFPFVLILLVPLRAFVLKLFFNVSELYELDKGDEDEEEPINEEDEPDFYEQAHMPPG